jgi:hypothetical protein
LVNISPLTKNNNIKKKDMSEEAKVKCSKENPCEECKEEQKKQLAKIEDWEVKRKEKVEKFEFTEAEYCNNRRTDGNKFVYSSFLNSMNINFETCPSCKLTIKIIKSNSYGDKSEELKNHAPNCQKTEQASSSKQQAASSKQQAASSKQQAASSSQVLGENLDNKTNYLPYILVGIGIVALIGIIVYFLTKKNKKAE